MHCNCGLHSNNQSSCTIVYIPYWRALSGGRCRGSSATPFQFIFIIDCQLHPTPYCRWPSFPGRRCSARVWYSLPDLVTSAHPHIPPVAVFRSRLKTHLFNISYPCDCTVPVQWLVALDTIIVLAYFLTYLPTFVSFGLPQNTHIFKWNFFRFNLMITEIDLGGWEKYTSSFWI